MKTQSLVKGDRGEVWDHGQRLVHQALVWTPWNGTWRKICMVGVISRSWRVGNGDKISLWHYTSLEGGTLSEQSPGSMLLLGTSVLIHESCCCIVREGQWTVEFTRNLNDQEVRKFEALLLALVRLELMGLETNQYGGSMLKGPSLSDHSTIT